MANEQYVVIARDPNAPLSASLIDGLDDAIPEVRIIERRVDRCLLECPQYCEADLRDYFSPEHYTVSRTHAAAAAAGTRDAL